MKRAGERKCIPGPLTNRQKACKFMISPYGVGSAPSAAGHFIACPDVLLIDCSAQGNAASGATRVRAFGKAIYRSRSGVLRLRRATGPRIYSVLLRQA